MQKSEELGDLCKGLADARPDWGEIILRFRNLPLFDANRQIDERQYRQYFSELHLEIALQQIGVQHPEWDVRIDPVDPFDDRSKDYMLDYDRRALQLVAELKGNPRVKFEYDKVITVGGLPIIFEVKLSKYDRGRYITSKWRGVSRHRVSNCIKNAMRREYYMPRLKPLMQYFGGDVGYVVVVPRDIYDFKESCLEQGRQVMTTWSRFLGDNGLVVPFYTDRQQFRVDVLAKVREYGLPVRMAASSGRG